MRDFAPELVADFLRYSSYSAELVYRAVIEVLDDDLEREDGDPAFYVDTLITSERNRIKQLNRLLGQGEDLIKRLDLSALGCFGARAISTGRRCPRCDSMWKGLT